jgi:hypothetical protein
MSFLSEQSYWKRIQWHDRVFRASKAPRTLAIPVGCLSLFPILVPLFIFQFEKKGEITGELDSASREDVER